MADSWKHRNINLCLPRHWNIKLPSQHMDVTYHKSYNHQTEGEKHSADDPAIEGTGTQ